MIKKYQIKQIKYFIKERDRLLKDLDNIEFFPIASQKFDFVYSKTNKINDVVAECAIKNINLQNKKKQRIKQLHTLISEFYDILNSLDDNLLKQIIELKFIYNKTYSEIADILFISETTFKRKLKNGLFGLFNKV